MSIEDNRRLQAMADEQDFELYAYAGPDTVFCVACAAQEDVENLSRLIDRHARLMETAQGLLELFQRDNTGRFIDLDKAYYLNDFEKFEEIIAAFTQIMEQE